MTALRLTSFWFIGGVCLLSSSHARGHDPGLSTLDVSLAQDRIHLEWTMAPESLEPVLRVDSDRDGEASTVEIASARLRISGAMEDLLRIDGSGRRQLPRRVSGKPAANGKLTIAAEYPLTAAGALELQATALKRFARGHRLIATVRSARGERLKLEILDANQDRLAIPVDAVAAPPPSNGFGSFVAQGVWHIWIGYDHIAFLVLLLLPVVLRGERAGWRAAEGWRNVMWGAVRIVTAFTLAHSITLSLAALGVVTPPDRPVEMAIAASVAVAGLLNLIPAAARFGAWIAFSFGLVHGFGFANALGELGLESRSLALPLAGFNLGVEAGQLTLVAMLLPLLYALRSSLVYRRRVVPAASIAVGLLAVVWLIERAG